MPGRLPHLSPLPDIVEHSSADAAVVAAQVADLHRGPVVESPVAVTLAWTVRGPARVPTVRRPMG